MHVAFSLILLIWAGIHFYIGTRMIPPAGLSKRGSIIAWAALALVAALVPSSFIVGRSPSAPEWFHLVQTAGFVAMGFLGILFPLVLLRDLGWSAFRIFDRLGSLVRRMKSGTGFQHPITSDDDAFDPGRRRFLVNSFNLGVLGVSGALAGAGFREARRTPDVVDVSVPIPGLSDQWHGYKIAQISDTHVGPSIRRRQMETIVETVNSLRPDAIVITGDLADGFVPDLRTHVAPIANLSAPDGVYFVTGNHEYFWDLDRWLGTVREMGIAVLLNEHRVIERGNRKIVLAGVTDYSGGRFRADHVSNPGISLAGAPEADARILLAHQPRTVYGAVRHGFDLQLSGHTHGGQFYPWVFLVPLQQPYVAGLHRHENTWVYVNRGAGYWGPPLRLGAPSEITLIRLIGHADA
ncbi:MAG TPA: metallophosphoesterase [Candidatus Latescibacteria bacterium]|nr:metallophosphoesterase [Candidatus Latescibacterota bacterium]